MKKPARRKFVQDIWVKTADHDSPPGWALRKHLEESFGSIAWVNTGQSRIKFCNQNSVDACLKACVHDSRGQKTLHVQILGKNYEVDIR